ncbi:MAG: hypothetical protein ACI9O4_001991, partial [Chitinophagales bacterium]
SLEIAKVLSVLPESTTKTSSTTSAKDKMHLSMFFSSFLVIITAVIEVYIMGNSIKLISNNKTSELFIEVIYYDFIKTSVKMAILVNKKCLNSPVR